MRLSSFQLIRINAAKLKVRHRSLHSTKNRNTFFKRSWFSSEKSATKKEQSVVSTTNAKHVSNRIDKSLKGYMPLILRRILSPDNATMTKPVFFNSSIAAIFGHTAFLMTGLAYLTKDILHLRLLAMSGISMSMIFQYYRPQPLKMPIRWNFVFLMINCVMASLLWKDRHEAESMSDEMFEMYHKGMFEKRGFRKVDFYRLFGLAKKEVRKKGEYLKRAGEKNYQLCYIVSGVGTISRDQSYLGEVTEHDFVGEIEFMRMMTVDKDIKNRDDDNTGDNFTGISSFSGRPDDDASNSSPISNESIIVESDVAIVYTWEYDELKSYLDRHVLVSNALLAFISHELREKLAQSWNMKVEGDKENMKIKNLAVDYLFEGIRK